MEFHHFLGNNSKKEKMDIRKMPMTEAEQPVDLQTIIGLVRQTYPGIQWTRLRVTHPGADNDRLWFFWLPDLPGDVQIECASIDNGCPFLAETDKHDERFTGQTIQEVAQKIIEWLALPGGNFHPFWFQR
jgi:hypothetical protein